MKIEWQEVLKAIILKLEKDLDILIKAADDSRTSATHEETQAKSKYETFALEASYLAHGQSLRAQELIAALKGFDKIPKVPSTKDEISLHRLIELAKDEQEQSVFVFLTSWEGGSKVTVNGESITVITSQSPMGEQLLGLKKGDTFEISTKSGDAEYEVLDFS